MESDASKYENVYSIENVKLFNLNLKIPRSFVHSPFLFIALITFSDNVVHRHFWITRDIRRHTKYNLENVFLRQNIPAYPPNSILPNLI